MAKIGDGLFARGDCEAPGHRAMSESGKLREDEPHPVALLLTAAQFGEDPWYFDVIGRQSGKRYRIRYGTAMNVCEMDSRGKTTRGWCFVPCETFVADDVMLAQKIALETDEWRALAVAIKFKPTWY